MSREDDSGTAWENLQDFLLPGEKVEAIHKFGIEPKFWTPRRAP